MQALLENILELNKNKYELLKSIDKPKIGWTSIYTPEEIFYAAGIATFRITGDLGVDITDASVLLGSNFCSYVLSCLSEGLNEVYSFADGVIFIDACDMRKRLYETWTSNCKIDYSFFMELPKYINRVSKDYFRLQNYRLIQSIENHFKCKITEEALRESITNFNKSRRLLQQMYELRKEDFPCISGNEAINIVKASTCGLKEEFNRRLEKFLEEAKASKCTGNIKKQRVLICGSYFDNSSIVETIEKFDAIVVCEDISNGIKYFEGQIDESIEPIKAISDYYIEKASCARMIDTERRFEHLYNLIQEYKVDSVIYFSLKFCDTNLMDFPYIKNKLQQKEIPVMLIEGEQHMINIESIKTRIQTFLEINIF